MFMFVDDLVIPAVDQEEAFQRLKKVLEVTAEYGLEINKRKAQVMQTEIELLRNIGGNGRLSVAGKNQSRTEFSRSKVCQEHSEFPCFHRLFP